MLIKLEWLGYRTVEKLWRHVKPFSSNTGTLRTDGQTDGRTELLYQYRALVCWRAIKVKRQWKVEYAYHFRKCADAVYQKLSKLVHACWKYSLLKLARFWDTVQTNVNRVSLSTTLQQTKSEKRKPVSKMHTLSRNLQTKAFYTDPSFGDRLLQLPIEITTFLARFPRFDTLSQTFMFKNKQFSIPVHLIRAGLSEVFFAWWPETLVTRFYLTQTTWSKLTVFAKSQSTEKWERTVHLVVKPLSVVSNHLWETHCVVIGTCSEQVSK